MSGMASPGFGYTPTTIPAGGTKTGTVPGPGAAGYIGPGSTVVSTSTGGSPGKDVNGNIIPGTSTNITAGSPADAPSSLQGLQNAATLAQQTNAGNIAAASMTQGANLTAAAEARRMADYQTLLGQLFPGGTSASSITGTLSGPGGTGTSTTNGSVPYPQQQIQSAQDIAFARAKDRVAENARASMSALAGEMAGRGIASTPGNASGIQENAEASVLNAGGGELADVISQQASDEAAQAAAGYNTAYQGGITQRGQDITQAGNVLAAKTGLANSVLGLIKGAAY